MGKVEEILSNSKMADVVEACKLNKLLKKKEDKKVSKLVVVLAVVGGIVLLGAIIYGVYRLLVPKTISEFEDEFEDEWEDEFFEDDAEMTVDDVFEEE